MDERVKLLRQVQQCDFTLYDLQLYLDTHPACRRAMEQYEKHLRHCRELEEEYVRRFGPLRAEQAAGSEPWSWVENPWPWEGGQC